MNQRVSDAPVLITLTGGRSTPAILAALTLQPRTVEFINSKDESAREEEIRKVLPHDMATSATGLMVSAHEMHETIEACRMLLERHEVGPFVVNLSCGTKVMALGAYEFAKQKGFSALYVDTAGRRIVDLTTRSEIPLKTLKVAEYVSCFGRTLLTRFKPETLSISFEKAIEVASHLVQFYEVGLRVLGRIRVDGKGNDQPRTRSSKNYAPSESEQRVWDFLVDTGLLADTAVDRHNFRFTIQRHGDYAFLEGGWLELFCWNQARLQTAPSGDPLFDDVQLSFEIPSDTHGARKEIDVGLMYGGQLIIFSCKAGTSHPWATEYLDELSAVSSLLGGRFCSRIFVTANRRPTETDSDSFRSYQRFINQAKDREIVVITGEELHYAGDIIAQQAIKPTYWRV